MNTNRAARISAVALASLALAGIAASPALAATQPPASLSPAATAQSNSNFVYSDNWLVNDSNRTVHVKAQADVAYSLESPYGTPESRKIVSKTVEKDLQPGQTLRMMGASGGDTLFEYHLYVTYPDGASADVAMYNPKWGQPWTRDGHAKDDKSYIEEGESHTNDVGNGHSIEVDRHWNHEPGEDPGDSFFDYPGPGSAVQSSQTTCNWDYHIR